MPHIAIEYNTVFDNRGPGVCIDSKGFAADDSGFVIEYNNFYNSNAEFAGTSFHWWRPRTIPASTVIDTKQLLGQRASFQR